MPRLNLQHLDFDEVDKPIFEPVRRSTEPVNGKHDLQRRAENGINRFRKARLLKEQTR
jgi:hypothetical protein